METRGLMLTRMFAGMMVGLAALRVAWLHRRLPLDQLVEGIRQVPALPHGLRKPEVFQAIVNRWYRWLPPRGLRSCLKRSYLLLDLWTRCGLQPQFHLGVRKVDGVQDGHAWLTVEGFDGGGDPEDGYQETFVA